MPDFLAIIPTPLLFALGSLLLQGFFELLYQFAHRGPMHEGTYMVFQSGAVFASLAAIGGMSLGFELTGQMAMLGILSGVLGLITGFTHLYAMGRGPGSVTSAVRRLSFVVTALLAVILLGERLTGGKLLAMGIAALALVLMGLRGDALSRPHPAVFIALVTSGLMTFIHKVGAGAGVSFSAFLMMQSGTAHLGSHLVCLRGGGYRLSRNTIGFALTTGTIIGMSMVLAMAALQRGEAVVIAPILQLGFLVTAPLSFIFMREPITAKKLIGLALGASAILSFASQL